MRISDWSSDVCSSDLYDEDNKKVDFSHNPFSMPQGEMEALETMDPLDILAWQYDIVCNGVELSSGAIRNHKPEIMYKAFEIAGYTKEEVEANVSGRSEEHTSELQSLMRSSYAVFCLKTNKPNHNTH